MTTPNNAIQALILLQSIFFLICILHFPGGCFCLETDTITRGLFMKDPDTIVSPGHVFKLGFFTPKNSTNRYLGIFYNVSEVTVIWVANRNEPLTDSSGFVTMSEDGNLVLINGQNQTIWSTNATITTNTPTTIVQILDTGNLVVRDNATGATIWESFSHPSNVYVPTMKLSDDINTGKKVVLSSWKNESDPGVGSFTTGIQALQNVPQIFIWNNGRPHWRSGPYSADLSISSGINDSAGLFYFTVPDSSSPFFKVALNSSGTSVQTIRYDVTQNWDEKPVWFVPKAQWDVYGVCGTFASCMAKDPPVCSCFRGFEPANEEEWRRRNWTSGCRRINQLQHCNGNGVIGENRDRFLRKRFMKIPDFPQHFPVATTTDECRSTCLRNCSCIACVYDPNIGCLGFSHDLIDLVEFDSSGSDLYIRLSASDFGSYKDKRLFILISIAPFVLLIIFLTRYWMRKRKGDQTKVNKNFEAVLPALSSESTAVIFEGESGIINLKELPLLTFNMIANATNQFHDSNLLGKGGFGSVYRGNLGEGKEIAVKRLSMASRQGMKEFMNEVIVICKLQHRNLVKLLGCCVEKEEKMLIYEYMPNNSLDVHLFDPRLRSQKGLDWNRRFSILQGIGRGLLYLHRDSRLRIIHRDLKPSNVLLDEEWEPKISDFGMARIFGVNEDHGNTARIVGTYGYMAPEYAMEGRFSEESDVYSFGVMMLEIIKGQKNSQFYNHEWSLSLLGCAWKLWSEGNGLDFADEAIASPTIEAEIVRCIQIALLCVQQYPKYRPSILTALSMLNHEIVDLPEPERPVFIENWNSLHNESTQIAGGDACSINELSVTVVDGR